MQYTTEDETLTGYWTFHNHSSTDHFVHRYRHIRGEEREIMDERRAELRIPDRRVLEKIEKMFHLCLSSKGSKVENCCFQLLFPNVAIVKPIQTETVIKNYIIKLQVRGQEDNEQERRKYKEVERR